MNIYNTWNYTVTLPNNRSSTQRRSRCSQKFRKIHRKPPVPQSLWNIIKKEILAQVFSCDFCEISKNTFSYRTLPVDTSEIRISLSIQVSSDIFCQYFFVCSELYSPEAALKRCSKEMVLCKATLLKSHFSMGVLLKICCIFSHLFLRIPLEGCF